MATTTQQQPPVITITPATPVTVVTPAVATTYVNFQVFELGWMIMQGRVKINVRKTDTTGKGTMDTFFLSPTEMAILAAYQATAGETFIQVATAVCNAILKLHYGFTA